LKHAYKRIDRMLAFCHFFFFFFFKNFQFFHELQNIKCLCIYSILLLINCLLQQVSQLIVIEILSDSLLQQVSQLTVIEILPDSLLQQVSQLTVIENIQRHFIF
jgi:hypothetical protein